MIQFLIFVINLLQLIIEIYRECKIYKRELRGQLVREMRERERRFRNNNIEERED